jgi:hypothetical protein
MMKPKKKSTPLISVGHAPTVMQRFPFGFGFWMETAEPQAPEMVWVWITPTCLDYLEPSQPTTEHFRLATLIQKRPLLEASASAKFEKKGTNPADDLQEGKAILFLRSGDILRDRG